MELLQWAGALVALASLLLLAWEIWQETYPLPSFASWFMGAALDALIVGSCIAAGKNFWPPSTYMVGVGLVAMILFAKGQRRWSRKETWCAIAAAITAAVWIFWSAEYAILAGAASISLTGIPKMIDMYRDPKRETWWVWTASIIACVLTLLGSDGTLAGSAFAVGGIGYNVLMLGIVLLKSRLEVRPSLQTRNS